MNVRSQVEPLLVKVVLRFLVSTSLWLLLSVIVLVDILAHYQAAVVLDKFCPLRACFHTSLLLVGQ